MNLLNIGGDVFRCSTVDTDRGDGRKNDCLSRGDDSEEETDRDGLRLAGESDSAELEDMREDGDGEKWFEAVGSEEDGLKDSETKRRRQINYFSMYRASNCLSLCEYHGVKNTNTERLKTRTANAES